MSGEISIGVYRRFIGPPPINLLYSTGLALAQIGKYYTLVQMFYRSYRTPLETSKRASSLYRYIPFRAKNLSHCDTPPITPIKPKTISFATTHSDNQGSDLRKGKQHAKGH